MSCIHGIDYEESCLDCARNPDVDDTHDRRRSSHEIDRSIIATQKETIRLQEARIELLQARITGLENALEEMIDKWEPEQLRGVPRLS